MYLIVGINEKLIWYEIISKFNLKSVIYNLNILID